MARDMAHELTRTLLTIIAVGCAVPALAQTIVPPKPVTRQAQATQPPVAPLAPAPSPPREWTGEDGASGHPEMKASAIRAAAANFEHCLEGLWPLAQKRNISRASFDKAVKGLKPDLRIMDLMDSQPEFTKAFWDYLDILVNDDRVKNGLDILAKHKAVFDKVEKQYGVDRYTITAIWGVEFELRHAWRRSSGDPFNGNAGLRRPAAGVFPRRVSRHAGNPASWRRQRRSSEGFVGRCVWADAVHADLVQALCGRR